MVYNLFTVYYHGMDKGGRQRWKLNAKYLIEDLAELPFRPEDYPSREIEQGYLCTDPVVRVRRDGSRYFSHL